MSFRRRNEPILDMNKRPPEEGPDNYAPPAIREESVFDQIKSFGELPTRELDEIVSAAEDEIAALKREAQDLRDMYVRNSVRIASGIRRLQKGVKLSMETMHTLRTQCSNLDKEKD